ncbi:sensor histidine kinase efflux regulator BaeS [Variovorax paradoxus]|uniref:histidine kinase n=1 Tax=Variovorax paradoxus TaxID=34073 RepID=A0A679JRI3_VARPD|nr:Signal transduction histidine-protein kinase BaeS [Variovorax paradoxus]
MKISITTKLFLAVLATAVLAVVAMGAASRWNFERGFVGYLNEQGVERLDAVLPNAIAAYRQHGSWDFLREGPGPWFEIMRPAPSASGERFEPGRTPPPVSDLTGAMLRIGLLDTDRRVIAGFREVRRGSAERAVVVDGKTVGWVVMAPFQNVSEAGDQRFQQNQARASWVIGGLCVLLAAGIAWWIARVLLAPVKRVAGATHRLAAGDYESRVAVSSNDEVGQLARDFNSLAHTLQRNEQMRREFMADVSHELRTPLGVLHGELEAMEDGVRRLDAQAVRSLQHEVGMLNQLVTDLYDLSLADVGALTYRKTDADLRELLGPGIDAFRERLAAAGLRLELALPAQPLMVFADERRLQQLFSNLVLNSCRYTDAGGVLRIAAREEGGVIAIDLMDSAPGVDAALLPRLFERFFRGEGSRNRASGGAGLGLSICRSIVEAHGGTIEAKASPLGGVWVAVRLPRA